MRQFHLAPTTGQALESILMKEAQIKYSEASKLVSKCRSALGMTKYEPWNTQLKEECDRMLAAATSDHGNNDDHKLEIIQVSTTKDTSVGIDETTSFSESDDENNITELNVQVRDSEDIFASIDQMSLSDSDDDIMDQPSPDPPAVEKTTTTPTVNESLELIEQYDMKTQQEGMMEDFFGWSNSTQNAKKPVQKNKIDGDKTLSNFFGQKVDSSPCPMSREAKPPSSSHEMLPSTLQAKTPTYRPDSREHHLHDPTCRMTPLEALMLRRYDLKYEDAACLVAEARTNLNESKWDHWTDKLYNECEKLYQKTYGPEAKEEELENTLPPLEQRETQIIWSIANPDDLPKLRAPRPEDFEDDDFSDCSSSSGYHSVTGWSSIFDDDDDDGFSVSTHDRDDQYSVGVIAELRHKAEKEEFDMLSFTHPGDDFEHALRRERSEKKRRKRDGELGTSSSHSSRSRKSKRSHKSHKSRDTNKTGKSGKSRKSHKSSKTEKSNKTHGTHKTGKSQRTHKSSKTRDSKKSSKARDINKTKKSHHSKKSSKSKKVDTGAAEVQVKKNAESTKPEKMSKNAAKNPKWKSIRKTQGGRKAPRGQDIFRNKPDDHLSASQKRETKIGCLTRLFGFGKRKDPSGK